MDTGYFTAQFAQSYACFGDILTLPNSGISLIKRPIPGGHFDLMGVYPYTMTRHWDALQSDHQTLIDSGAVSVTFITDPLAQTAATATQHWHISRPFKPHYVVDLRGDWWAGLNQSTRRHIRASTQTLHIKHIPLTPQTIPNWADTLWALYANTTARHQITGLAALSRDTIECQLAIKGAVLIGVTDGAGLVGAQLNYIHDTTPKTAAVHLVFLSTRAHALRASYPLFYETLKHCETQGCSHVNLGGAAGTTHDPKDGLAQFKRGWSKTTASAYICGEILQPDLYQTLCKTPPNARSSPPQGTGFFPAYRRPNT